MQITCNKSEVTYKLENEKSGIHQHRLHAINMRSLTPWKVKGEWNSSAQVPCDKPKVAYKLEGEERERFISTDHIQQIQGYLHSRR